MLGIVLITLIILVHIHIHTMSSYLSHTRGVYIALITLIALITPFILMITPFILMITLPGLPPLSGLALTLSEASH